MKRKVNTFVKTQNELIPMTCRALILSVPDFLARASRWQESVSDSEIQEALCSLKLPEFLERNGLRFYFWKTSRACCRMTKAGHLKPSSPCLLKWGTVSNGVCLTANTFTSHSKESGCSLSDFLMEDVPEKYFLSETAVRKICKNSLKDRRGVGYTILQAPLALNVQAQTRESETLAFREAEE